jgi:hypothetical protein
MSDRAPGHERARVWAGPWGPASCQANTAPASSAATCGCRAPCPGAERLIGAVHAAFACGAATTSSASALSQPLARRRRRPPRAQYRALGRIAAELSDHVQPGIVNAPTAVFQFDAELGL